MNLLSTKLVVTLTGLVSVTFIQYHALYLDIPVPTEYIGVITGMVGWFVGAKTYQNVSFKNGK